MSVTDDCPYKNYGGPCPSCSSPVVAPVGATPIADPWMVPLDPDVYAESIRANSANASPVLLAKDLADSDSITGVRYWVTSPSGTISNPSYGLRLPIRFSSAQPRCLGADL